MYLPEFTSEQATLTGVVVYLRALSAEAITTADAPSPGAHGTRTIFLHPRSTGGVLVELAEYPEHAHG